MAPLEELVARILLEELLLLVSVVQPLPEGELVRAHVGLLDVFDSLDGLMQQKHLDFVFECRSDLWR